MLQRTFWGRAAQSLGQKPETKGGGATPYFLFRYGAILPNKTNWTEFTFQKGDFNMCNSVTYPQLCINDGYNIMQLLLLVSE